MSNTDGTPDAESAQLARRKLAAETAALERKNSYLGIMLDTLQGLAIPIAIAGLIVTTIYDYSQVRLTAAAQEEQSNRAVQARSDEQFQQALVRLSQGIDKPSARTLAIVGLKRYAVGSDSAYRSEVLSYLVDVMMAEDDDEARKNIVEIFHELNPADANVNGLTEVDGAPLAKWRRDQTLDASLDDALRQNRVIVAADQSKTRADEGWDIPKTLPRSVDRTQLIAQLRRSRLSLSLLAKSDPVKNLKLEELADIIQQLVNAGGRNGNFSGIYCWQCLFRPGADMHDVSFENSHLHHAVFREVDLHGASFANADIGGADMRNANLRRANLTMDQVGNGLMSPALDLAFRGTVWNQIWGVLPDLAGAHLEGANLTGLPLFEVQRSDSWPGHQVTYSLFRISTGGAHIDRSTVLSNLTFILEDERTFGTLQQDSDLSNSVMTGYGRDWFAGQGEGGRGLVMLIGDNSIEFVRLIHLEHKAEARMSNSIEGLNAEGRSLAYCALTMAGSKGSKNVLQSLAIDRPPLNAVFGSPPAALKINGSLVNGAEGLWVQRKCTDAALPLKM